MYRQIAGALLQAVFFDVSAVVSLDEKGNVLEVFLFSTDYPQEMKDICGREIWLISHHPQGCRTPSAQDFDNYARLSRRAGGAPVRLFLSSEYFACFEVAGLQSEMDCGIIKEPTDQEMCKDEGADIQAGKAGDALAGGLRDRAAGSGGRAGAVCAKPAHQDA